MPIQIQHKETHNSNPNLELIYTETYTNRRELLPISPNPNQPREKGRTCEGFGEEDPRSSYGTKGQLRSSWGKPAFSRENSAQFSRKKMNQFYFRVSSSLLFSLNSPGGLKLKQFQTHAVLNFS